MIQVKKRRGLLWLGVVMSVCMVVVGCSSEKKTVETTPGTTQEVKMSTEPVTLKIMYYNSLVSKADVDKFIAEPIKKKYPFITVQYIETASGDSFATRVASGQAENIPDLVITDYSNLSGLLDFQYSLDLNPAIKKDNVDLSKVDKTALEGVRSIGSKGELYGLPLFLDKYMMFYNKDIFNRFAVPFPTGDMTYEDFISLVKKMTRTDNGVQYYGYRWVNMYTFGFQLGLPVINAKTGKADIQTDGWKRALSYVKEMIDVGNNTTVTANHFLKDQVLAMYPQWLNGAYGQFATGVEGLNWDLASLPYAKELPKVTGPLKPVYLVASSVSKYKDQTAAAISYLTTSAEAQTILSQNGRISVLTDDAIRKQFGTQMAVLNGKDINSIFKYQARSLPNTASYETVSWAGLNTAPVAVTKGIDVNTALREAEEASNKAIDAALKK